MPKSGDFGYSDFGYSDFTKVRTAMRWQLLPVGAVLLLLGAGCLNYTSGFGFEHHRQWAKAHHLPAPSQIIFMTGILFTAIGSGLLGFVFGRRVSGRIELQTRGDAREGTG